MTVAIISDIHSNEVAFETVLKDMQKHGISDIICLGDVIGYGARAKQCVDYARKFMVCLKGNHERMMFDAEEVTRSSYRAADAIHWTRMTFESIEDTHNKERMDFVANLPETHIDGDTFYCHGSPRSPVDEYVKPLLGENKPDRLRAIFDAFEHTAFIGHTHFPGVFTEDLEFHMPASLGNEYKIGPDKAIINVGSVGQPRDRNSRACYVVFDGEIASFRRVRYDIDLAASRIYAVPELDDSLGDRLYEGR